MSKDEKCMQQVSEIVRFAMSPSQKILGSTRFMRRCIIFVAIICHIAACDGRHRTPDAPSSQAQLLPNDAVAAKTLRRGLPGEPRTLDPQLADDTFSFQVVRDLYEGLTAEDRGGRIVPGAAKSWTVDSSGKIYTFVLRDDARWSDGERTLASEFLAGLRRAVDPHTASGSASLLNVIKNATDIIAGKKAVSELGVTQIDESSIKIELERPAPFILEVLAQPIAAPVHASSSQKSDSDLKRSVTNGAYTIVSRITGSYIELARNKNYWDAANVRIEKVRYVNVESEATELREYSSGDLDLTYTVPTPDLTRVQENLSAELQTAPLLGTMYLALDVSEPPFRGNRDLRQALSMAVDREQIAKYVTLGVTPAYAFVSRGITGYSPPAYEWSQWPRDRRINYAQKLLQQAGYSETRPLTITLYSNTGEGNQRIMLAIAGSWKQNLGVETKLVSDEFRVFLSGRKDRSKWDAARLGWWADYNDASSFLEIFTTNGSQNDPDYSSPTFDGLMSSARLEPDPSKRALLLQKAEGVLLDDYPIVPVYFYVARRLVKPNLGGAEITPLNRTYSRHLYWKALS
jgi:oligopeptide transport system substrate-binding protein